MAVARLMVRSALMNVMMMAAQKAGRSMVRDFNELEHLQVSKKSLGDFVSTADHRSEKLLIQELSKARPGYAFLVEESGEIPGHDPEHRWVIDPLDGTSNFLHGIPHFAISIGLQRGDEVIAGVVYNPVADELYWAEKGQGAFLNQRRLRVSGRKKLEEALIAVGSPYGNSGDPEGFAQQIKKVMPQTAGIRRYGAASLDLAYVASGRFDGYFESHLKPWDIAAGILLVREAGGYVSEINDGEKMLESGNLVAANPLLFEPLKQLLLR